MTFMLVCALCTATVGESVPSQVGQDASTLPLRLELDVSAPGGMPTEPVPLADHSGHDGGSGAHLTPMWIMMGIMMVGMMVVLGVYMMRGSGGSSFEAGSVPAPHLSAIPIGAGFRPGG